MKYPINILSADVHITDHWADSHVARHHAYLDIGYKLAGAIANKAFTEPTIIRAGWIERRDVFTHTLGIRASIQIMPFKDWAIENLRAGDTEFGSILSIPLTNERMMIQRDMNIFYTK